MKRLFFALALAVVPTFASEAGATVIFESATLGPEGQLAGLTVSSGQWLGVEFTLDAPTRVTRLGAHYVMNGADGFIGIFPVEEATGLPPEPADLADALVVAPIPAQTPSEETSVEIDITLPAGTYAVVVGSTSAATIGTMPVNNPNIGDPLYIVRVGSGWNDGALNAARFFVEATFCGDGVVESPETCEDMNLDNTDACLDTCVAASCGDGFIQAGVEACDDGDQNGVGDCTLECTVELGEGGGGQGGAGGSASGGGSEGGASQGGGSEGGANSGGSGVGGAGMGGADGGAGGGGSSADGAEDDGCGCRVVAEGPSAPAPRVWAVLGLAAAALLRRRR